MFDFSRTDSGMDRPRAVYLQPIYGQNGIRFGRGSLGAGFRGGFG